MLFLNGFDAVEDFEEGLVEALRVSEDVLAAGFETRV